MTSTNRNEHNVILPVGARVVSSEDISMKETKQPMLVDCPVYEDDLAKAQAKKKKSFQNIVVIQLNRLMTYFRLEAKDIHNKTGIPFPTLSDWVNGKVDAQMLDDNIPKIIKAIDPEMTIDFFAYGIPKSDRDKELDERMPDLDEEFVVDTREAI
jgi:hypothetical protein